MGLTIYLEGERGQVQASAEDPTNILHRILPSPEDSSFILLRFIDWYGDTVFNRLQMPTFIREWEQVIKKTNDETELALLRQVREMAERCGSQVHMYLKFDGD